MKFSNGESSQYFLWWLVRRTTARLHSGSSFGSLFGARFLREMYSRSKSKIMFSIKKDVDLKAAQTVVGFKRKGVPNKRRATVATG